MRRVRVHRVAFFVVFGVLIPVAACGTSAQNVDTCNTIEAARCNRASQIDGGCGIDFMAPFADGSGTPAENAATCIRFYTVACLHGTINPNPISQIQLNSCVNAIADGGSCAVVLDPLEAGANCAWLADTGAPETSVADTATTDTSTDAATEAVAADAFSETGFCLEDAGPDADATVVVCTLP